MGAGRDILNAAVSRPVVIAGIAIAIVVGVGIGWGLSQLSLAPPEISATASQQVARARQTLPMKERSLSYARPAPTFTIAAHCWIYDKIFPATTTAYKSQHLTLAERHEVEKWAAKVPSSERSSVRWMRDEKSLLIFIKRPIANPSWNGHGSDPGYAPWVELNGYGNVLIDPLRCWIYPYSKA